MKDSNYSYSNVLVDVLNYFVSSENIDVLKDTSRLQEICNLVREGKRYSLNGYRLDTTVLMYALLENSLQMNEITKSYVSDLTKEDIDYDNIQDCNLISEQFYQNDDLESFVNLLMENDSYFSSLIHQFIDSQIIDVVKKKKEVELLKQVANKSDYTKELEKEKERYYYLSNAVLETYQRHSSKDARIGFLHYVEYGDAKALSNAKYRKKLNAYSELEIKTVLFDYFIREYSNIDHGGTFDKIDFINQLKNHSEKIYQYQIPKEWLIEFVNDTINGLYQDIDKNNSCYQEYMRPLLLTYQKETKVEKSRKH